MALILDGTTGVPVTTVTGTLPVANGGTGVTTSTGTGANVLGTSPTITGATITVAATAAPAFSAYQSVSQSINAATFTKVTLTTERFDTNNNFASSTFTPTVAGYYQINGGCSVVTATTRLIISIYKNGSDYAIGIDNNSSTFGASVSSIIYCNGTTDYLELYIYSGAANTSNTAASRVYFDGAMVRSA
jgi:hypothetical protein